MSKRGKLTATGKKYTFDTQCLDAYDNPFEGADCAEYAHARKRYIRVVGKPYDNDSATHDGRKVKAGEWYWIEVEPIEWLVDPSGIWVSRESLFAGIRFNPPGEYDGDFSKTEINQYLKKYFVPQMQQNVLDKIIEKWSEIKLVDVISQSKGCFNCEYNLSSVCSNQDNISLIKFLNSKTTIDNNLLRIKSDNLCIGHRRAGK